jgi:predicted GNAT family N-acyltransferase
MKIEVMEAAAHTDNIYFEYNFEKKLKMTEQYLEDNITWNWYQLKNPKL